METPAGGVRGDHEFPERQPARARQQIRAAAVVPRRNHIGQPANPPADDFNTAP